MKKTTKKININNYNLYSLDLNIIVLFFYSVFLFQLASFQFTSV